MKRFYLRSAALLVLLSAFVVSCMKNELTVDEPALDIQAIEFQDDIIPGKYIVVFDDSKLLQNAVSPRGQEFSYTEQLERVRSAAGNVLRAHKIDAAKIEKTYAAAIRGIALALSDAEVNELRNDPAVRYIEQDRVISVQGGPPFGGGGSCADNNSETVPCGINVVNGGANYTGSNVAWIIDTGIDTDHPDLNVDASRGFYASDMKGPDKNTDDGNGHGTHVAGTVAAIGGNGIGVVGVAAGATVIPVKVLDRRGSGSYSGVIEGVDFVGANGSAGDVANMSLGGGFSQAVNDAVVNASSGGIWFAIAAGNSSDDANDYSPASANGPYVRTISAMDCSGNWASFSNYANPPVDFCAPGVSVCSTVPGGYDSYSGTSMAAPHAAGVLLATGGNPSTCGTVSGDPDGNADPIICQ